MLYFIVQVAAEADKGKKGDKKKEISELNELFKPVVGAQKVSKGEREISDFFITILEETPYMNTHFTRPEIYTHSAFTYHVLPRESSQLVPYSIFVEPIK